MSEKIIEALKKLDPAADDHWTADGLPKVEALGIEGVKRADVTKAAPHFKRDNLVIDTPAVVKAAAEAAKPEPAKPSLDERRKVASDALAAATKVLKDATKAYDKALVELDDIEREAEVITGRHHEQQTIMDYLAAQKKLREEKVKG